ncbi:MAG: hypothetical protein KR126chlam2_01099 [Chlamydiae bacterium]|nr:hypothetical protein [Chlamydiota bacterium]
MRVLVSFLILLTSCSGYHFGHGGVMERYCSICVPFVEGDNNGQLTNALISQISSQGILAYRSCGADLLLKVCIFEPSDENIGFNYASINDEDAKVVVANEARLSIVARVSLIERSSQKCLLGPIEILSSIAYDFEPDLSNVTNHNFAIGQLEMNSLAKDAAFPPLYNLLAQKIVDYLAHSW